MFSPVVIILTFTNLDAANVGFLSYLKKNPNLLFLSMYQLYTVLELKSLLQGKKPQRYIYIKYYFHFPKQLTPRNWNVKRQENTESDRKGFYYDNDFAAYCHSTCGRFNLPIWLLDNLRSNFQFGIN